MEKREKASTSFMPRRWVRFIRNVHVEACKGVDPEFVCSESAHGRINNLFQTEKYLQLEPLISFREQGGQSLH